MAERTLTREIVEEACRQWCDFIEDAPERKSGDGFWDFVQEIAETFDQEEDSENEASEEQPLYEVVGYDEMEDIVFAHCTSEELAESAI